MKINLKRKLDAVDLFHIAGAVLFFIAGTIINEGSIGFIMGLIVGLVAIPHILIRESKE